ncbi:MAG TPA: hypothetical protein VL528_10800 [Oxalicibacterium sp.]|nr:hypothetical protein [Oxalicibacterium sp.]
MSGKTVLTDELYRIIRKFGYTTSGQTSEIVDAIEAAVLAAQPSQAGGDGAKDVERLDFLVGEDNCVVNQGTNGFWLCWLDGHDSSLDVYQEGSHPTARAAIDAAIAAGKHKGE